MNYTDIREECCEANRRLPEHELVDMTFGNVSCLDRAKGVFAIKPSGVDFPQLTPADMVIVDLEGNKVEGSYRPSSDTETHRRLFMAFGNIRAVAHDATRAVRRPLRRRAGPFRASARRTPITFTAKFPSRGR